MANLDQVASIARPVLKGIDWDALAAKGPNQFGVARNTVYASDYYYDYIRPAGLKAMAVIDTLDIDINADEAFVYFKDLYTAVKSVTNIAYEAAIERISILSDEAAMKMHTETLRGAIAICWYTALYGAELHRTGALVLSGKMSEEEVVRHAVLVTTMFECITLLDGWDVLKPIKKGSRPAAAGLGVAPIVVAGLLIIAAVVVIAIIAWLVLGIMDVSAKNAAMKEECQRARESGDQDLYGKCLDALSSPDSNIATALFKDAVEGFAPYIAMIVGGVTIVALLPFIVGRIQKAGEVSRHHKRKRREKQLEEAGY